MTHHSTIKNKGFTLVEIMIVVAIIGIIIAIAVPAFIRAREVARARTCQENLAKLDGAVDMYALDHKLTSSDTVIKANLMMADGTGYLKSWPICNAGGEYADSFTVDVAPTCSLGENADAPVAAPHILLTGIAPEE